MRDTDEWNPRFVGGNRWRYTKGRWSPGCWTPGCHGWIWFFSEGMSLDFLGFYRVDGNVGRSVGFVKRVEVVRLTLGGG